jgi:hypothetical protein
MPHTPKPGLWSIEVGKVVPVGLDLVIRLIQGEALTAEERRRTLRTFAELNGWNPSDALAEYTPTRHFASGHILVDQGLENSLVISFLKADSPIAALAQESIQTLLSISYNHLVDLHLVPDSNGAYLFQNRAPDAKPTYIPLLENPNVWNAGSFQRLSRIVPRAAIDRLDRTLIDTVSHWKKLLASTADPSPSNASISALFNSVIFVRALEDLRLTHGRLDRPVLSEVADGHDRVHVRDALTAALSRLGYSQVPPLLDEDFARLQPFNTVPADLWSRLLADFYKNRFAGYPLDFSLISKQALSL